MNSNVNAGLMFEYRFKKHFGLETGLAWYFPGTPFTGYISIAPDRGICNDRPPSLVKPWFRSLKSLKKSFNN